MDDRKHSISPDALYTRNGSEAAPIIADVRRDADFAGADTLIADAFHRSPDASEQWRTDLPEHGMAVDNEFTVSLDGTWAFTAFDETLSQPGRIALWTKGDGVTRFDQIEIVPLP